MSSLAVLKQPRATPVDTSDGVYARSKHDHVPFVAVDFDGRIAKLVEGFDLSKTEPREGARERIAQLRDAGIHIGIWTGRNDKAEVEQWLAYYGIGYDAYNENPWYDLGSRKIIADIYLDDRGEGDPEADWDELYELVVSRLFGKARQPCGKHDGWEELQDLAVDEAHELRGILEDVLGFPSVDVDNSLALGELEARLHEPGGLIVVPPIKLEKRAREKVEGDYGGDWRQLLDIVRAGVAVESLPEVYAAARAVLDSKRLRLARMPKDRFREPLANGYRDYLVNYRLRSGLIVEVQYHCKPMLIARERAKISYDVVRAITASMEEEGREDMTPAEAEAIRRAKHASKRIYAKAWEEILATSPQPDGIEKSSLTAAPPITDNVISLGGNRDNPLPLDELEEVGARKGRGQPCKPGETAARSGCIPSAGNEPASAGSADEGWARREAHGYAPQNIGSPVNVPPTSEAVKKYIASLSGKLGDEALNYYSSFEPSKTVALRYYTADGYLELNKEMRSCPPEFDCVSGHRKFMMHAIEEALQKAPEFAEPVTVFRGIGGKTAKSVIEVARKAMETGGDYTMPSITSTSLSALTAVEYYGKNPESVIYQIRAKRGLYVEPITLSKDQYEVMQSAKTRYKVAGIADVEYNISGSKRVLKTIYLEETQWQSQTSQTQPATRNVGASGISRSLSVATTRAKPSSSGGTSRSPTGRRKELVSRLNPPLKERGKEQGETLMDVATDLGRLDYAIPGDTTIVPPQPMEQYAHRLKDQGTCRPGERADLTGCIPASPNVGATRGGAGTVSSQREYRKPADSSHQLSGLFSRIARPDGGFTYQPVSRRQPSKGYAVSPYPNRSAAYDAKALKPVDVVRYMAKNRDLLSQPDHYLGAWHDPASGKVFLDISVVKREATEAETLSRQHDQIAYFDLGAGKSVTVNPNATSGGAANAPAAGTKRKSEAGLVSNIDGRNGAGANRLLQGIGGSGANRGRASRDAGDNGGGGGRGLTSRLKGRGQPCKPGETAAQDGCIPRVRLSKPRKPAADKPSLPIKPFKVGDRVHVHSRDGTVDYDGVIVDDKSGVTRPGYRIVRNRNGDDDIFSESELQHLGGKSTSENTEGQFTEEGPYSEHTNKVVQAKAMIARGVAHELGFPQNKIHVNAGKPYKFELNGETQTSSAHYDRQTREIVFEGETLNDPQLTDSMVKGTAAHEIWHAIFHVVTEKYIEERAALHTDMVAINEQTIPVTPKIAAKYPTYAAMFESMEGRGGKAVERLMLLDGVSPYSVEYWHGVYNHTVGPQQAITETLSEMARLEVEAGPMPDAFKVKSKAWVDLRDAMMKEYNRLTGRQP